MGKVPIFTKQQQIILDEIKQSDFVCSHFYLTGGTALSALYLQHRYSEDLDFFSLNRFDNQVIFTLIDEWAKKYQFTFQSRFVEVVYMFQLTFPDGIPLKLDFAYYPYNRLEESSTIGPLEVDSLLDIATNKLLTISQRSDAKDFVDLYFLLKLKKFSLWDLREGVQAKFHLDVEPILLAADFLKVEAFTFLPKMLVPLELEELKHFYRGLAKKIGSEAVE